MYPTVSVIIPAYNSARSLPAAIASVRNQHWPKLEIIVVDDGSTDNTLQILDELSSKDLRVLRQANAGPSAARNAGIKAARSEWIAFLDADDKWLPGKLAAQFEQIQRQPEASFAFTDVRFEYPDGRTQDVRYDLDNRPLLAELLIGNVLATPTIIVRRNCLQQVGDFDTTMRTGEDWDMWLRLATHFTSVHVPVIVVVVYRANDGPNPEKYPLEMLERCTIRVLDRLFACSETARLWPQLAAGRRVIYAWQYSVLAKSYLFRRLMPDYCRLASKALLSHPLALVFLTRRGEGAFCLVRRRIASIFRQTVSP